MPHDEPNDNAEPSQPTNGRPWLRLLVSVLLMVIFVGALLTQVDPDDLLQITTRLHLGWAVVCLLAYASLPLFRGWRLSALLNPRDGSPARIPWWRLVLISAVQNYLIFILPLRAGEVSFVVILTREKTVSASLATKALVAVRILDGIFVLASFLLVAALPGICPPQARALALPVAALLLVSIGLLLWPNIVGAWLWRVLGPIVRKLEQWRVPGVARIGGYLEQTMSVANIAAFRAALPSAILCSLMVQVMVVTRFWAALNAVGADIPFVPTIYIATAMTILSALPIHGLAGFGPGDAAGAGLLMTVSTPANPEGFAKAAAIALQLGSHVIIAAATTIVGLLGSLGLQRGRRKDEG